MPGTQRTETQTAAGGTDRTLGVLAGGKKAYIHGSPVELVSNPTVVQRVSSATFQDAPGQAQQTRSDLSYAETIKAEPVQIVIPMRRAFPRGTFVPIEQWEGIVLAVEDNSFSARLVNKTNGRAPDEEGQFTFAQLSSPEDRELITPGAIFYFSIGYGESPSRQRRLSAFLRFRRLPAWTKTELAEVEAETSRLAALFGLHHEDAAGEEAGG
jgi:hypothetical protein